MAASIYRNERGSETDAAFKVVRKLNRVRTSIPRRHYPMWDSFEPVVQLYAELMRTW